MHAAGRNMSRKYHQELEPTHWVKMTLTPTVETAVVVVVAVASDAATADEIEASTSEPGEMAVVRVLTQGG